MDFELDDDQRALQDSVARVLADHYGFEQRRAIAAGDAGHSPAVWRHLAGLGITALLVPQDCGGFGGGARDLLPVMQAFGRVLLLEPFLASCVLGATAVRLAGGEEQRQRVLPGVASGETLLSWAHDEAQARHAACWTETHAQKGSRGWTLTGVKVNVLHAGAATHHVVSARLLGAPDDEGGRALFLVEAASPGVRLRAHRLVDDTPAGELHLVNAAATPLGAPLDDTRQRAAIDGTLAIGIAAACADMVGTMEAAHALAMGYLNTRKQFGRLIGENQALRHRAAEMLVSLEVSRSMAIGAAIAFDSAGMPEGGSSPADLHRAKLVIGRHARTLCQLAIQLHGGIGMTEEYAVGHALRRLHVMDQMFGDSDAHAARLAASM